MSTKNPKIGELVVAAVNAKTGLALTFSRFSPNAGAVVAHDASKRLHVIPFYGDLTRGWFIRSVLVANRRNGPIEWLTNGQATKGRELHYFNEGDCMAYADRDMVHAQWAESFGPDWREKRDALHAEGKTYIMAYPAYLDKQPA